MLLCDWRGNPFRERSGRTNRGDHECRGAARSDHAHLRDSSAATGAPGRLTSSMTTTLALGDRWYQELYLLDLSHQLFTQLNSISKF